MVAIMTIPTAPGQKLQTVVQPVSELPRAQNAHAGRGKLQGQGDSIQAVTDAGHRTSIPFG